MRFVRDVSREEFENSLDDDQRLLGTIQALQNVSEAARHLAVHDPHYAEIQTRDARFERVSNAGDFYRHQYGRIDPALIWDAATSADLKYIYELALEGRRRSDDGSEA
jgi:hypothetical protein